MLKIIILVNWGLGCEMLTTLHHLSFVEIELVVTQYDLHHHDQWYNAVYRFAVEQGYKTVHQNAISFDELRKYILEAGIDLLVCHAFMRILPESVYTAPRYGSINIHASLLPKYRGPSPTYWVLKNKEPQTGLTCHYIDHGIDTGDIIHQITIPVDADDTIVTIIEKQKKTIHPLLIESLSRILDPNFKAAPQQHDLATYAPKPKHSM